MSANLFSLLSEQTEKVILVCVLLSDKQNILSRVAFFAAKCNCRLEFHYTTDFLFFFLEFETLYSGDWSAS